MNLLERDKELSRRVYELYISTNSKIEYMQGIKELSNETNVAEKYLLSLLEEFYEMYATKKEKETIRQIRKRNSGNRYKKYVEEIIKMSEEELKEQIKRLKIGDIKEFFGKYIKNETDKEIIEKVKRTFEKLINLYEEEKNNKIQEQRNKTYTAAIAMLDKLVDEGYFSIVQFKQEKFREYHISEEQLYLLVKRYLDLLKNKFPEKYEYYIDKMEKNRLYTFNNLKPKIEEMISSLPNNYDIIDYYLNIGIAMTLFKRLYNGLIAQEDEIKIKIFFSKYSENNYPMAQIYSGIPSTDKKVTDETETRVLNFMKEHKIPINYFFVCYKKYKSGKLDEYFHQKKKEF